MPKLPARPEGPGLCGHYVYVPAVGSMEITLQTLAEAKTNESEHEKRDLKRLKHMDESVSF